jgi:hypothetical protein
MTRERSEVWWTATGSRLTVLADWKGKGQTGTLTIFGQSSFKLKANDKN